MSEFSDLSIVIIARNEAENIARAIESALRASEHYPQTEILLVDSASTDATVEIARQYPINIVRLNPAWFLSAAAGRYIGMHYTRGSMILYMDGDMELVAGWLEQAVPFLGEHSELAGVAGYRHDIYIQDGKIIHEQDCGCYSQGCPVEAPYFAGSALYRRSALEQVRGFNPFIISDEEPELCMRLRHAGYKLMYLPYLMCVNYTLPVKSWDYFMRRFRTNLWLGHGQVPRYHLKTGLLWMYLKERGTWVVYLMGVLISVAIILLTALSGNIVFLEAWLLIVAAFLGVYWVKKRSLRETWLSVAHQSFAAYGAVRGFLMTPRPLEEYPTEAEIVQLSGPRRQIGEQ
jgi:glycosyltransferase involved in cell wall biosynthesis